MQKLFEEKIHTDLLDGEDKFGDIQSSWVLFFNGRILWVTGLKEIISL